MAAAHRLSLRLFKPSAFLPRPAAKQDPTRATTVRCSSTSPAKRYNITLLPGDGIGPEVVSVAKSVLKSAGSLDGLEFDFKEMLLGGAALDLTGVPLPEETLSTARKSDAVLLGAIGGYKWDNNEKHLKPETGLLQIREGLNVFANLRPASVLPQLVDASTLKREVAEGVDLVVVRELTGGIYFGKPRGFGKNSNGDEIGFNTEVYAAYEIARIARIAFETARKRRGKLCSVDKANVLEASMFWRKIVTEVASEYPDIELSHMLADNAAMQLVRNPKQFDTIVTNNLFGDILSDEASMITGSIGMLPSASLGELGPGLFEPIHGSAPDIAGQDKANPLGTVLSAAMLLRYGLGEEKPARRIENAVMDALDRGFRTGDIYSAGKVGRKPLLCVLGVPNHMTYADFCQFCGSFIQHVSEMRIVRTDGMEERYSILIRVVDQKSADAFYKHFQGRHFSSLEVETCHVRYTVDVQYTGSIEHAHTSPASSTEQPSCPVCLERLDQDMGGILTTICNHSFHCSCISKWTDSSCPVCRYCQQQPEKSTCFVCQTSENLWMCVICGFVGCGRYKEEHAIWHWKETQHCYSLELDTQRVWDYAGDNYVHRLIQSKTDGKLVELNHHCAHGDNGLNSCTCGADPGVSEALLNSKVEAIVNEYSELLTTQLENQRKYYESLLQEVEEETERETSEAVKKALTQNAKLQKMQGKFDKCIEEKKFLDDIYENLSKNKEIWEAKIVKIEEREKKAIEKKEAKIQELEEQLRDMMLCLEAGNTGEEAPMSNEINGANILPIQVESSSQSSARRAAKTNGRRNG